MSCSRPLWAFAFLCLCFLLFFDVVTASSGWGDCAFSFFLLETVNAGWASGDEDLSCFFLFFQWRCRLGHEHVGLLVVFVVSDLHYRLSVLSYRGFVEGPFLLAPLHSEA